MDDIMIWGTNTKSHLQTAKKVLDVCKRNNVTLNREKCHIAVTESTFLGDRLTGNSLKPIPAEVKPIIEFTTPKNKRTLQDF